MPSIIIIYLFRKWIVCVSIYILRLQLKGVAHLLTSHRFISNVVSDALLREMYNFFVMSRSSCVMRICATPSKHSFHIPTCTTHAQAPACDCVGFLFLKYCIFITLHLERFIESMFAKAWV